MPQVNLELIRSKRKALGIRSQEMSRRLGVAPGTYSRYEYGVRQMSVEKLARVADILGLKVDDLIVRDQDASEGGDAA